jgi:hypothetical protein
MSPSAYEHAAGASSLAGAKLLAAASQLRHRTPLLVATLSQPCSEIEPRRPQVALPVSPVGHGHRARRISVKRAGEPLKDHIARFLLFLGLFMQIKGISAIEANSQGRPCN